MLVMLSRAACQHIAYTCNERSWRETGLVQPREAEEMRLRFVKATLGQADTLMFDLSRVQVRALDMMLTDADPRDGKLPDGTRILELVEAIWGTLIGGDDDARDQDHHQDLIAGADTGAAAYRS